MRALVVEDDEAIRGFLEIVLADRGHDVQGCRSAEDAWEAWRARPSDIVLLDWRLPGEDGLSFCRRLRAAPDGRDAVVLFATAHGGQSDLAEVLAAGADDYLTKPFPLDLLELRLALAEARVRERRAAAAGRALGETAQLVAAGGRDADALLDEIAAQTRALFDAAAVAIHLAAGDGAFVRRRPNPLALPGTAFAQRGDRFAPDAFAAEAIASGRPLFTGDTQGDPRVAEESKRALPEVRATLTVPLQYQGAILGLLTAVWTRPHALGGADLDAAAALGAHAALAVHAAEVGRPG